MVAAARGGVLSSLTLLYTHSGTVDPPFSIRALLPRWVYIEVWNADGFQEPHGPWISAAMTLRPALAHTSHALASRDASSSKAGWSLLAREDVQAIHYTLEGKELPRCDTSYHDDTQSQRYFLWLQDAELAQQVADAWNHVVERGNPNLNRCYCNSCPQGPLVL